MQLCNPWTSGDGAEVSIAIGVHRWTGDARLRHDALPAPSPSSIQGIKAPIWGLFASFEEG